MATATTDTYLGDEVAGRGSYSGIKSLWNSRLRSYRGGSADLITPKRTPAVGTPSSAAAGGLTDTPAVRGRASSVRPASSERVVVRTSGTLGTSSRPRHSSAAPGARRSISPLAKSLFRNYLLQGFEPHEPAPALTVVLDLDETLVSNRSAHLSRAILRPYCLHVLNALRHMRSIEIVLWTASTKDTAAPVVEQLHESGIIFDDVIFRNDLWFTEPVHTKDLRLLGRDMDRVVIIDNAANCCKLNPRNAILIDDFHGYRHEEDAALINVYYTVESLLKLCNEGMSVRDGLAKLSEEARLCHNTVLPMPEAWKNLPLGEISPLKIPPFGRYVRSNTSPPSRSIMKYWTY